MAGRPGAERKALAAVTEWRCDISDGVVEDAVGAPRISVCRAPADLYDYPGYWTQVAMCPAHLAAMRAKYPEKIFKKRS